MPSISFEVAGLLAGSGSASGDADPAAMMADFLANPQYGVGFPAASLDAASLDDATVAREKAVLAEKNAGKPAHVLEKIVESGLKSYYKEVSLLDQPFIHDATKTVAQAVKEAEKTAGAAVAVTGFARFARGEGIEKPEGPDFAAEVASLR